MKKPQIPYSTKYSRRVRPGNLAGLTLIEVLIALVIFSFAMIISSGVFSNIVGNQSLVSVNSEVNREAGRIMRQISDDATSATEVGLTSTGAQAKGMLFLDSRNAVVTPGTGCLKSGDTRCNFSGLVLFSASGFKIYHFDSTKKIIEYATGSGLLQFTADVPPKLDLTQYTFQTLNSDKVEVTTPEPNSDRVTVTTPGFRGIACYTATCDQEPIVWVDLTVQTKDYSTKSAKHRASLQLTTAIAARSY